MTIITLKPDALVGTDFDYATIYPYMGLNESGLRIMSDPGTAQNVRQAHLGMGNYLYGSNLNIYFLGGWDTSSTEKIAAKAAIQTTWANRVMPWFVASPTKNNTCTNAALRVFAGQCYLLSASTGKWARSDNYKNGFVKSCTMYLTGGTITSDGGARRVQTDQINMPAFPFCPTNTDWAALSTTTTKYRVLHGSATNSIVLSDPSDLAGVFCTFESQLVSADGNALNGTPEFLIQCGADAGYDDDAVGSGRLLGAPYQPAIGGGRWSLINNDGTRRKHYFATFVHPDCFQDLTSAYHVAGGVSTMTAATFQANMPTRVYQAPL